MPLILNFKSWMLYLRSVRELFDGNIYTYSLQAGKEKES